MRLSSFCGVVALLLACVGLYGLLAYQVAQRTPEIGIRLALGATRAGVINLVLGETAALVARGILMGLALALSTSKASWEFSLRPHAERSGHCCSRHSSARAQATNSMPPSISRSTATEQNVMRVVLGAVDGWWTAGGTPGASQVHA